MCEHGFHSVYNSVELSRTNVESSSEPTNERLMTVCAGLMSKSSQPSTVLPHVSSASLAADWPARNIVVVIDGALAVHANAQSWVPSGSPIDCWPTWRSVNSLTVIA